jgi:hypothetical protein
MFIVIIVGLSKTPSEKMLQLVSSGSKSKEELEKFDPGKHIILP